MIAWLTLEDFEAMGLECGVWYKILIEYDPVFGWATVKVDNEYQGILRISE